MKKFFIIISILISINILKTDLIFATTSLAWTDNSGQLGCLSEGNDLPTNDGVGTRWKHGVPETNIANPGSTTGPTNCTTHYYYPSGTYTKSFVYNGANGSGYITGCNPGDRVLTRNESARTMTCIRHDDDRPVLTDITNPNTGTNVLAVTDFNYGITVSSGGNAPIVRVDGRLEKWDNEGDYSTFTDTASPWIQIWNIRDVDHTRESFGGRTYTYSITMVCDEAGNCLNSDSPASGRNSLNIEKNYDFKVYANTSLTASKKKVITNELTDPSNIADGTPKLLSMEFLDPFDNQIVPATGINRQINFKWNVTNKMYLDQFHKTGQSSLFITDANNNTYGNKLALLTNDNNFINQQSNSGIYDFKSKVYTPTSNQAYGVVSDPDAIYRINNINYSVTGDIGSISDRLVESSSNITAKFSPLYITSISGDLRSGFINNAVQHSKFSVTKTGSSVLTSSNNTQLYFTGTDSDKFNMFHIYNVLGCNDATNSINTGSLSPGNMINAVSFPGTSSTSSTLNDNFCTRIIQKPGIIVSTSTSTKLSSHVNYLIPSPISGNLSVLYNSDYAGSSSTTTNPNTVQAGIKTTGISSSSKASSVVTDQLSSNVNLVGNASKGSNGALLLNQKTINKTEIRKNAINFAKSIISVNNRTLNINNIDGTSNTDGYTKTYSGSSVLYFKDPSSNVVINSDEVVSGKRTILVIGSNLYIKGNITYNDNSSILGIIVLKNDAGQGGNIYINPSVTNISGTLFADKSIISYNGSSELGGSASIFDLKNQLYINGSIMSENTLGGSTKSTPECPAYITSCTDPQKYDINFLRRYYIIPVGSTNGVGYPYCKDYNDPSSCGKVAGGGYFNPTNSFNFVSGTLSNTYVINSNSDKYYKYPLIIDYNSKILSSPPPLFKVN